MKKIELLWIVIFIFGAYSMYGQTPLRSTGEIYIRDPFVVPDTEKGAFL